MDPTAFRRSHWPSNRSGGSGGLHHRKATRYNIRALKSCLSSNS